MVKKLVREVQILRHLTLMKENVHTVKMLDLVVSDSMEDVFIVMNQEDTDLKKILRKKCSSPQITSDIILIIAYKLLCALNFIHSANIIHRDIKPANILINSDIDVILCDFGLARTLYKLETEKKDYSRQEMGDKLR